MDYQEIGKQSFIKKGQGKVFSNVIFGSILKNLQSVPLNYPTDRLLSLGLALEDGGLAL